MKFGTSVKEYKKSPGGGGGGSRFISWLKEGETVLRFLEEYDDWTVYYQHFDRNLRRGYPCLSDDREHCPGCIEKAEDERMAEIEGRQPRIWGAQKFYLVNVLTSEGYVNLYQIPARVISTFERYSLKFDTLCDREYTIVKYKGDDGNWKFDVEKGDRDTVDLTMYRAKMTSHETALKNAYMEVHGPGVDKAPAEPKAEEKPKSKGDTTRPSDWNSPPPSEPAGAAEPGQEEEVIEISEEEMRKMTWRELVGLIAKAELPIPDSKDPDELATYLLTKLNAA